MKKPRLSIVVSMAENRGIGKDGDLPWNIPEDRKRFKNLTMGHPVIMGRTTFESILHYIRKPLPGRTNIILTRDKAYSYPGTIVVHSLADALKKAAELDNEEIHIGGGANVYEQIISLVDKLYLTIVKGEFNTDAFFPDYSEFKKVLHKEEGESNGYKYIYMELER